MPSPVPCGAGRWITLGVMLQFASEIERRWFPVSCGDNSRRDDARCKRGGHARKSRTKRGIVSERFYSGRRDGYVTVRDGVPGAAKRPLEPRSVLFKRGEKGFASPGDGSAQIALTILADALGDETSAIRTHEYFSRRVVAQFPDCWTISRSRVLAYVNLIEHEKRAGFGASET
jgi:Family of unknown function (DUF6166)